MGLETGTYLNDLVTTNPDGATDAKSEGDNHIRLIKSTLKATFPGMAGAAWRNQVKAASYALQVTDNMTYIAVTAAATITGTAATLGNGWSCIIYNGHTAAITTPGSNTLHPGESVFVVCTGSIFANFRFQQTGWRLLERQTPSSAATVTFTGLSSTFFTYKIVANFALSQNSALHWRSGAGSTDTGNNYKSVVHAIPATNSAPATNITSSDNISFCYLYPSVGGTPQANTLDINFYHLGVRLQSAATNFVAGVSTMDQQVHAGVYTSTGTVDRVVFFTGGGTISGTFSLYGLL